MDTEDQCTANFASLKLKSLISKKHRKQKKEADYSLGGEKKGVQGKLETIMG